jgi:hypothetical protein
MAFEASQPLKHTFVAAGDLSAKQYHFVKLDTDGKVVIVAAITDKPIGVLQNNPASGEEAEVVICGITKVSADSSINEGDLIGTSSDGQADTIAAGTDTTVYVVGQCLLAAGAAARIGTIVVNCASPARAA